jgi:hypothetical protein
VPWRPPRDWNVKHSGSGYVTRFRVRRSFLHRYDIHQVGGRTILEYWIPAEDLGELNANIIGLIELVAEYHQDESTPGQRRKETSHYLRGRSRLRADSTMRPAE